ncbi:MAG TPA: hypothetical protein PK678_12105 [Ferruginibacter sp.]|nr:hypothetical protein [Ferruginibacter sp.]HMX80800.1 hypothetical protein [Ferruginibacter sp.]HNA17260.1 hypothetical protein [Ferruginibacter sp.]
MVVYLSTATPGREFFKVPQLVEHYWAHVKLTEGPGFLSYLFQHYVTESDIDQDAADDQKLPFKSPEISLLQLTSSKPPCFYTVGDFGWRIILGPVCEYGDSPLLSLYANNVWQPPRM